MNFPVLALAMVFPLEIFSLIVKEIVEPPKCYPISVSDDDWAMNLWDSVHTYKQRSGLRAICLTCKAFLPLGQRELFATVKLDCWSMIRVVNWDIYSNLDQVLQQSPHLAGYIRNLYFYDKTGDHPTSELVSGLLSRMNNVQSLTLASEGRYTPKSGEWSHITHLVASAIENIVKLPSLRTLRIREIQGIPPEILRRAPQLQCLRLYHSFFQPWSSLNASIEPNPVAGPSIVQPFSGLKTLAVEIWCEEDVEFFLGLVKINGNLRELQWNISPDWTFAGLSSVLSTGISQTLTKLTLTVISMVPVSTEYPCQGLEAEFWLIPTPNVLQSITFKFLHPHRVAFSHPERFREIDAAATPERFPHLTNIQFHFFVLETAQRLRDLVDPYPEYLERYRSNFPSLSSRKGIDFQCILVYGI